MTYEILDDLDKRGALSFHPLYKRLKPVQGKGNVGVLGRLCKELVEVSPSLSKYLCITYIQLRLVTS